MATKQLTKRVGQRVLVSTPTYPAAAGVITKVGWITITVRVEVNDAVIKIADAFAYDLARNAADPHPDAVRKPARRPAAPRPPRPRPTTRTRPPAPAEAPLNVVSIDAARSRRRAS